MKNLILLSILAITSADAFAMGGAIRRDCEWLIPDFRVEGKPVDGAHLTTSFMTAFLDIDAGGKSYNTQCQDISEQKNRDKFVCVLDASATAIVKLSYNKTKCTVEAQ